MWWNAASVFLAILSLAEVKAAIPLRFVPLQLAVVSIVNLWLRTTTTRPVAFIAPGAVKVLQVPKIDPPAPPLVGD